jgi:glutamate racemase
VARVAYSAGLEPGRGALRCATTGDPATVAPGVAHVWGSELPVEQAIW